MYDESKFEVDVRNKMDGHVHMSDGSCSEKDLRDLEQYSFDSDQKEDVKRLKQVKERGRLMDKYEREVKILAQQEIQYKLRMKLAGIKQTAQVSENQKQMKKMIKNHMDKLIVKPKFNDDKDYKS